MSKVKCVCCGKEFEASIVMISDVYDALCSECVGKRFDGFDQDECEGYECTGESFADLFLLDE